MTVTLERQAPHTAAPAPIRAPRLDVLADVPHAIPYQGSKRALAHAIIPLLPDDTTTLYEPFAGSAAVSVAAMHARRVGSVQISDANEPLVALWSYLLTAPQALADGYEQLWYDQLDDPRAYYNRVRDTFNQTHSPVHFLYLLARCVKAAVRYNQRGEFNQGADQRRLGAKPHAMRDRLQRTSAVMRHTTACAGDYRPVLLGAAASDVVYMDPPYEGVSQARDTRYLQGLRRTEFEQTLGEAVRIGVSFMVSYDGTTGGKQYGAPLDPGLGMAHLHLCAGRSSQSTLNGAADETTESLYLSPALVDRLGGAKAAHARLVPEPINALW
ncbi:MAG: DNA adenine methylase [Micrococcales bacterium]|nr:DNA adenine methylase [Micrococcales bacterium]